MTPRGLVLATSLCVCAAVEVAAQPSSLNGPPELTSPPPVLRTADPAGVKTAEGSNWHHAMVIGSYTDADLESILIYLRLPP